MVRPCFLVVDRESPTGISTRKLVIETAKFNVITAYSSQEAIDVFRLFPAVAGVVTDNGMTDMPTNDLISALKEIRYDVPVIVVRAPIGSSCDLADHCLDTFNPTELLAYLQRLEPAATAAIEKRTEDLEAHYFKHQHKNE